MIDRVARIIRRGTRFVATTHVNPDGDGIGSGLALVRQLRRMGKKADLICCGQVPPQYQWLPKAGEIVRYRGKAEDERIRCADAVFVLDLADWRRLHVVEAAVRSARGIKITIDHHPKHANGSDLYWRRTSACSVGEMLFDLFGALRVLPVTREVAIPLYVSLMTDTGCFRFSNADSDAHEMAAALIRSGVEPFEIYNRVYESSTRARLRLMGEVLAGVRTDCGGRLAWAVVSHRAIRKHGVREEETEGFIDVIRTLGGVEVSILFKEPSPGGVRVSFRSRRSVDVNRLAARLGGGGHARAAGLTLDDLSIRQALRRVLPAARRALG